MKKPTPYLFDEFFLSGLEPSISPFLTKNSKKWCKNLALKSSIFSLILLFFSIFISKVNVNLSFLLLAIIFFLMGIPAILNSLQTLKNFEININVLMTIAAFISLSIGKVHEGALLLVLFGISNALESTLSYKTKSAIHSLNKISPQKAFLIQKDGSIHEKSIKEISIGDNILIKAGEIVPLDGIVIKGTSSLNLEHLTGETTPILKKRSDQVHAGSINIEGTLTIKITKTSSQSTINQIIKLISRAQKTKPRTERFFDKFSKKYATTVLFLSIFFAISFPIFFSVDFKVSLYRAIAFLIAASPCALLLAIPTAYLSSISACARRGIILKGGSIIDALFKCKTIAFDKTGTLTTGKLEYMGIEKIDKTKKISKETALKVACELEEGSSHPIAKALSKLKEKNKILIKNFKSVPGYGVEANVKIKEEFFKVFMGSEKYIEKSLNPLQKQNLEKMKKKAFEKGEIITLMFIKKELFIFKFSDSLRKNAKNTVAILKTQNKLQPLILTGDNKNAAEKIAKEVNIKKVYASLKPEDKLKFISSINDDLAMVGDGINDAPALAKAGVGISLGKVSSATAVDASDVILLNDKLSSLPFLFNKANKTKKIVSENLTLALLVIALASIPALLGLIPLYIAVIMHEGGTLLVGLNSLRLLRK